MPTLEEAYTVARQMPLPLRLRLAAMLLEDAAQVLPVRLSEIEGYSDIWKDEDRADATAHSARYLDSLYPEEEDYPLPEGSSHAQAG